MLRTIVRTGAFAAAAILALSAAQPAEAAGGRRAEARAAGKATRAVVRPVTASRRPVAIAPVSRTARAERGPRVSEARGTGRTAFRAAGRTASRTVAARGPRETVRFAAATRGTRYAVRTVGRTGGRGMDRRQAAIPARSGLRMVSLFSAPAAAATLPARGSKYGKPSRFAGDADRAGGYRSGTWHAGLPAPDGEQTDCPSGTMAVLARGHADTFRCMPM